ncbi:MAG: DUF4838 domain-containing protein [Armatimonadota bacterium]
MRLLLLLLPALCWGNLIENGGFEAGGTTTATGFCTHFFEGTYQFTVRTDDPHSGNRCVSIKAPQGGWARWYTTDVFLLRGARYRLSCWVRSDCPEQTATPGDVWLTGCGVSLRLPVDRSRRWHLVQGECRPTETGRGGLYLQSLGAGEVFFDDVSLEMTAPPPAEAGESVPTDGAPLTAIVIPAEPAIHHLYLAHEARRLVQEMTGRTLAIRPGEGAADERAICIDVTPPGIDFSVDLASLDDESIVVDIGPQGICCLGKTTRALNYAVTEAFRILGCRWYMPGPRGTIIPQVDRLALPPTHLVHRPSFALRGGTFIQVEARPPDFVLTGIPEEQYVDWATRNHMNRLKAAYPQSWDYGAIRGYSWEEYAGHTYSYLVPPAKYWDEHPEYWPLVRGRRTHLHSSGRAAELCVSNPEVARIMAEGALEFFAGHPHGRRFCINADDEPSYWCECDACRALDTVENDFATQGDRSLVLTDRCMTLVNAVATAVAERYPDRWVGTFAYGSTREVPRRVRPADNVMIELTWWDRCFKHAMTDPDCPVNAKGLRRLRDWQRWTDAITIYGYLQYPHWDVPQTFMHSEADFLRTVHRRGVRHITDEWDTSFYASALLLSLRARLLWDINTDVDEFVRDFCEKMYGPAAEPMLAYYQRMERAVAESPEEHVRFRGLERFTPRVMAECRRLLRQAARLAPEGVVRARIADQEYGLRITEMYRRQAQVEKSTQDQLAILRLNDRILSEAAQYDVHLGMGARQVLYLGYTPPLAALCGRKLLALPEMWLFRTDPEGIGEQQQWFLPGKVDENWKPISTHRAWEEQGYEHNGYGWYALDVVLPAGSGKPVWLLFEAVDETCDVWINGEWVGKSKGDIGVLWDKPVAVEITAKYRPGETNHIVVRVHDERYAGGIWKPVSLMEAQ